MRRRDRVLKLDDLLKHARYPVPRQQLMDELECSAATVYRVIAELRDLGAPIETTDDPPGYCYQKGADSFQLPGFWLTSAELFALLTAEQLLAELDPGLLGNALTALHARLPGLLNEGVDFPVNNLQRIRILRMSARTAQPAFVRLLAQAVLTRRRLRINYHARGNASRSERVVSPQRLTHYRDNWYLDAWCHASEALRTFSADRIEQASLLPDEPAEDRPNDELDAELGEAYGIFAGRAVQTAILKFSANRARWVAEEGWHPEQQGRWLADGSYELRLPYNQPVELMMDILKHGAQVEVIAPAALKKLVSAELVKASRLYAGEFSR